MPAKAIRLRAGTATEPFPWTLVPGAAAAKGARVPGAADVARDPAEAAAAAERLAALERDAFVKGYGQGERSGADAAARQGEAMLRRLAEAIDEMAGQRSDLLRRSERELVRLAVAIAERIVRREITLDRTLIAAMAKVALDRLDDQAPATVRLHPADHAAFVAASHGAAWPGRVQIVADPTVNAGGCVVQSEFGAMDLDISAQLAEVSRALIGSGEASDITSGASADTAHG